MNQSDKPQKHASAYLFNVDILVQGDTNAIAMEKLLRVLNQAGFADFRIKSGMELGRLIETLEASKPKDVKPAKAVQKAEPAAAPPAATKNKETAPDSNLTFVTDRIKACIAEKKLIRLTVNKGFGKKLSIPCRIINLDESSQMMTVYHVDEKQVYTFTVYEIEEFV
ncbi:hypothetical protein A8990_11710 [Paenibacillus taihuensis]|uniref:Uncharacterized protein n=1 Tax=Paenibacillus taihuensis TaxID=1156355 RepID=A0A3D9RZV2_9BACL|nr:hypothetical protein [Paenibacillus taihuensis]REE82646.1 hypothetical protein A8990_11710 [Paenibacillus taihuensis]